MKTALGITAWVLLAAGVWHVTLAPASGVVTGGPWAAAGVALLGLAVCRQCQSRTASEPIGQ